jgi:acyl carrier protein
VANPFSEQPGARMYRTGDLARHRPDGTLEFLGRVDHQIKLRGHRIELGEIEATIRQHTSVRDAVVLCREDAPGDRRLVAYLTADGQDDVVPTVRLHLESRLPDYMVPAAFVILDELPLAPNGKIDRAALPAPDFEHAPSSRIHVEPRTATEEVLVRLWREVLGVSRIGVYDNFFSHVGGHSLLGTQLVSRIRSVFGIELPLFRLFEAPTVAQLAEHVDLACRGHEAAAEAEGFVPASAPHPLEIERLSSEEVDLMLRAMLGGEEKV